MAETQRKQIDCRRVSQSSGCSLAISGTEGEVLDAAVQHAITVHGLSETPELRNQLRHFLQPADEPRAA